MGPLELFFEDFWKAGLVTALTKEPDEMPQCIYAIMITCQPFALSVKYDNVDKDGMIL